MRPYAVIRAVVILAFLAWVGSSVIPLLLPAKHVRTTDAADLPSRQPDPHPTASAPPPQPALTAAQVSSLLRQNGYVDVTALEQQAGGDWVAMASRAGNRLRLRIAPDGHIAKE